MEVFGFKGITSMAFDKKRYLDRLEAAGITYETGGTGQYKGDHYVTGGSSTPHIHVAKSGEFVGLKKKRGAITTLVQNYFYKIEAIRDSIDELKVSTATNDQTVTGALKELARDYKAVEQ